MAEVRLGLESVGQHEGSQRQADSEPAWVGVSRAHGVTLGSLGPGSAELSFLQG